VPSGFLTDCGSAAHSPAADRRALLREGGVTNDLGGGLVIM